MEEIENSVEQEIAPLETNQNPPATPPQETYQERNWRNVRQELSELKRQNQEKEEMLKKLLEQNQSKSEEPELPDDEYINKGHVKRVAKKTIEPLEKEIQELKSQIAYQKQQGLLGSLKSKYPDFDDVVNPETVALFEERKPELAALISELNDPYKMSVQSYEFIKASGILSDVPSRRRQKETEKMLEKNSKTMQSPQAFDKRPMAQAYRLTEEEKSNLYEEMMAYASQAGSIREMGA